jgi:KaiC/GvpD/RAD55 family RecA-like ATPase
MLDGGLVAHRPYLIVGPSGTGKTTLGLQFLCAGVQKGEHTLLVTIEEPPNEVRVNHRRMAPDLEKVDVFDAIPDVMRYERAPFKDIAAVRAATPFGRVAEEIRRTPELTSIEVTITALEQMLRTEVQRHAYTRIVIDSLTALQYFCMKGFDIVAGAQTFLRFLSDLRVTTLLTVEAPLEDVETPERMLARGEIRLFRWELDDITVRAVGVEKFRGSAHDIRLHPYRIGPRGLDINLGVTISRDTREIVQSPAPVHAAPPSPGVFESIPSTLEVVAEELRDLTIVGADTRPVRAEVEAALTFARRGETEEAAARLTRAVGLGLTLADRMPSEETPQGVEVARALHRLSTRADAIRAGQPPVRFPEPPILTARLAKILADLSGDARAATAGEVAPPAASGPKGPPTGPLESPTTAPDAPPVAPVVASPTGPSVSTAPPTPLEPTPPDRATTSSRSSPPSLVPPTPRAEPPSPSAPDRPPAAQVPASTPLPPAATLPPVARSSEVTRSAPPPLPRPIRYPEHVPLPLDALDFSPRSVVPVRPETPVDGRVPQVAAISTAPEGGVAGKPDDSPPAAAEPERPKKRKRAPAGAKKKAPSPLVKDTAPIAPSEGSAPAPLTPLPPAGASEALTPTARPVGGAPADFSAGAPLTEESPPPRPKRRVVRKKKAPPVIGATPGPVPEPDGNTPAPAPDLPPDDPPSEAK